MEYTQKSRSCYGLDFNGFSPVLRAFYSVENSPRSVPFSVGLSYQRVRGWRLEVLKVFSLEEALLQPDAGRNSRAKIRLPI